MPRKVLFYSDILPPYILKHSLLRPNIPFTNSFLMPSFVRVKVNKFMQNKIPFFPSRPNTSLHALLHSSIMACVALHPSFFICPLALSPALFDCHVIRMKTSTHVHHNKIYNFPQFLNFRGTRYSPLQIFPLCLATSAAEQQWTNGEGTSLG